jgi:hypothetical protein
MRLSAIGRLRPGRAARGDRVGGHCDGGDGDGEERLTRRLHGVLAAVLICASGAFALGCGDSAQKQEAQRLEGASILSSTAPLSQRLIKQSEIQAAPDSAAQRTFLRLWSTLQFGAWDQAEQFFQPGLRDTIGVAVLAQGLAQDSLIWQATKPRIVTASVTDGKAAISFLARDEKNGVVPASISFESTNGVWLVSYFSMLDGAVQRAVQLRLQAQLEPLGTKPSAEAVRQGNAAAALQSTYLERHLRSAGAKGQPQRPR